MRYQGMVIRPPSEADSYILHVTYGCSHNRYTFCGTYCDKSFQVRPLEEVLDDIALARSEIADTRRVFLADGNGLVLNTDRLVTILDALASGFPRLRRVGIYANARDILGKTDADLTLLLQRKLEIVYLGLESGSDEVLRRVQKGIAVTEMVDVHANRHTFIRNLGKAGVSLTTAQRLARHSDPKLTANIHTHLGSMIGQLPLDHCPHLLLL